MAESDTAGASPFLCPFCEQTFDRLQSMCPDCNSTVVVPPENQSVYDSILPMCGR